MSSEIKGLIFDLDGVIVDTAKYHFLAWKTIADELNIVFTEKDNERLKGVTRLESFEIILEIGNFEMPKEDKLAFCTRKNDIYLDYICKLTPEEILPNVKTFLLEARNKNYKIALGSASKNALFILARLNIVDLFDEIIDGNCIKNAKPDPEVFLLAAEKMGLKNTECIVFEDAFAGIDAAHNAGMKAVGIGDTETLFKADMVIESFSKKNVEDILSQLKK